MAPSNQEAYLATSVMTYMAEISEQTCSRWDKKIAQSSELKGFLLYLSERAPEAIDKLLKLASRKCEDALRVEKDARIARKRAEPPNGNGTNAKRTKITRPTENETGSSQQVAEPNLMAQGYADALQPCDNPVHACDNDVAINQESEHESFDWTNMTSDTLFVSDGDEDDDASMIIASENSHEVAKSLTGHFSPSTSNHSPSIGNHITVQQKPQKARTDAREDTFEQTRSVGSSVGDETPTPRSGSQSSEIVLQQTSAVEKGVQSGVEDSGEEDPNVKPTENGLSRVATTSVRGPQEGQIVSLSTPHQIEIRLPRKSPAIEACVKAHFLTLKPFTTRPHFDIHDEIAKILDQFRLLEFFKARRGLFQYLENRVKMPGKKLQASTTWNMSSPGEILDAIQTVKTNTTDAKIHRAYGQIMLNSSFNNQVCGGYKSSVKGHLHEHTAILEELARKKAGSVSELEIKRMMSSYLYEYYAGQKWSAVINSFGGSGIVLVFVTAGIGSNYVEKRWTEFQRDCVEKIADWFHNIRKLVEALGSDALEIYCRNGCLGTDCIKRVRMAKFTQSDGDEDSEDEDSEDDSV